MTHDELVDIARRWLLAAKPGPQNRNWRHVPCKVVLTELVTGLEIPDAIGWHSGWSILVECKTSVSDFRADAAKSFRRRPEDGLGRARFFLTPQGLLDGKALPLGWGLLETDGRAVKVVKDSDVFAFNLEAEFMLLMSVLQRVTIVPEKSISLRTYEIDSKKKATLSRVGPTSPDPARVAE